MERRGAIAIVFGIALLAAACSGDDSGDSDADRLPADGLVRFHAGVAAGT